MSSHPSSILIVDDNPVNRKILSQQLNLQGHKVTETANGKQALEILRAEKYDLILLDIIMPEMDGFEVLEKLKSDPACNNIPVIVLSSLDDFDSLVKSIELGADDYLPKPFNPILLKARIDASLEKKRLRDREQDFLLAAKRKTEAALQESEALLKTVVSNAPVILFAIDNEGKYTLREGKGLEMLDHNPKDLISKSAFEKFSEIPEINEKIKLAKNGQSFTTVVEINDLGWEVHSSPVKDDQGNVTGIIGVATDITERLRHERELEALVAFSGALRTTINKQDTFQVILNQMLKIMGIEDAAVARRSPDDEGTIIELASGVWEEWTKKYLDPEEGIDWLALSNENRQQEEFDPCSPKLPQKILNCNVPNVAYMPLIEQEQVIGAIWIGRQENAFTKREQRLLAAISETAANAIHRITLFEDIHQKNAELILAYDITIEGWSRALELRDGETQDHSQRVTKMTMRLARNMGVSEDDIVHIYRGALLHDIGKMAIPDSVLLKEGPLNEEEWKIIRKHPIYAYEMLAPIKYLEKALDIPYYHHERWDGSGYPFGLEGEDIPLPARIFAVVDVWDALSNDRPYREHWSKDEVLNYISSHSGKLFDPKIAEAFLSLLKGKIGKQFFQPTLVAEAVLLPKENAD